MGTKAIDAEISWGGAKEPEPVMFGIIPKEWKDRDLSEHRLDHFIFYWLDEGEVKEFGVGFTNGEWTVLSRDEESEWNV